MLELRVGYPSRTEEEAIVEQTTGAARAPLQAVLDAESVLAMQSLVRRIPVSRSLIRAAVSLARMTRPADPVAPALLRHRVVTNFAAEAADRTSEDLVRELIDGKGWLSG